MIFHEWVKKLSASGYVVCPGSSAVPVEVTGIRPDGVGFHFRCRGVQARLGVYRTGRARWQVPLWDDVWSPEEALQLWELRVIDGERCHDLPEAARLVFTDPGEPDDVVVFDGSVESDWRGYDAGLLSVDAAAKLFERLSGQVAVGAVAPGIAVPAARAGGDQPARHVVVGVL